MIRTADEENIDYEFRTTDYSMVTTTSTYSCNFTLGSLYFLLIGAVSLRVKLHTELAGGQATGWLTADYFDCLMLKGPLQTSNTSRWDAMFLYDCTAAETASESRMGSEIESRLYDVLLMKMCGHCEKC